jgi:hypothetical protein
LELQARMPCSALAATYSLTLTPGVYPFGNAAVKRYSWSVITTILRLRDFPESLLGQIDVTADPQRRSTSPERTEAGIWLRPPGTSPSEPEDGDELRPGDQEPHEHDSDGPDGITPTTG